MRTKIKENNIETITSTPTESIQLTLDSSATNLLIERLTDLYTNKPASIVRELVSNALDATVENNGEVHITYPTTLEPVLIIEDFGCGMSYDDIINIYTKYGASNKLHNLDTIGSYGLGAKVPLTYTESFLIETIKNNNRIIGNVLRTKDGLFFNVLRNESTNKPNGTKITIDIQHQDVSIFQKACEIYYKNQVLIDTVVKFHNRPEVEKC